MSRLTVRSAVGTGLAAGLLVAGLARAGGAAGVAAGGAAGPVPPVAPPVAPPAPRAARPATLVVPAPAPAPPPVATAAPQQVSTGWPALDAAIARIPGYATAAPATWTVSGRYGHDGSTLWPADVITISPGVPAARLDSVVRHEWAHVLQDRAYGGDPAALVSALRGTFGGPGTLGAERAADCMARLLGATWTYYTPCTDPSWRAAAATLLSGRRPAG